MNEIARLDRDLAVLARRRPLLARALGGFVTLLGIGGMVAIGPWWPAWYPLLFIGCVLLTGLGIHTLLRRAASEPDLGPFLLAARSAALPFDVCLGCPRVMNAEETRCECLEPELFEVRSELDRRMIFARFNKQVAHA